MIERLARALVLRSLGRLRHGRVRLVENLQVREFGPGGGPSATIYVSNPKTYPAILLGGTIGAAEAYMQGHWSCDDLASLVRCFATSPDAHYGLENGLSRLAAPARALEKLARRNTRRGSRRNIAAHYDLGNDFYRLFLDDTLAYSCGIFADEATSLRAASEAKFDAVCEKLEVSAADHLLEIGCGWGGFALHAASRRGCRVTAATISREQYQLARKRVRDAGLSHRVEIVLQDYRDLRGSYDKLVSIEMIEAVGHGQLDRFFARCGELLKPEGSMLLQSITIADQDHERHRRDFDFIKRYIFPGACIPSVTVLIDSLTRASDLRLFHLDDISWHYALTLRRWREEFRRNLASARRLGFSERFLRMWDFYLAYCEGGFAERYLGDVQMTLVKPAWRPHRLKIIKDFYCPEPPFVSKLSPALLANS
jgi:cyclopropane-fatty-acyl-phospholipid synthase